MQQTGLNADDVHDTNCSVFKEGGATGIRYKLNSVGQVNFKNTSVLDNNIQNLTPGSSSEFVYTYYKIILIDVNGKPMIQLVVENINIEAKYIFIVQKEHYKKYNLKYLLNL